MPFPKSPALSSPNKTTRCRSLRWTTWRRALGLSIGLPLANARAICPELTVFDADEAADAKTLNDIADWCDRFTPLVALDPPHGLFLDITGCAHLFGGEARTDATRLRRADPARLYRQRGDRRHLDLRAHADAPGFGKDHRRWRGGRSGRSAAGLRARRRRGDHRRPASRRPENHRRCRLARAP